MNRKRNIGVMTLAAILLLGFGTVTFASGTANSSNSQWNGGLPHVIKGEILKIEGDIYTVRDSSGREVRVHVDQFTKESTTLKVGDTVVARIAHIPSDVYARSLQKAAEKGNGKVTARYPMIEGTLLEKEGGSYVVQDMLSGKKVRLQVDKATTMDNNITVGDRVEARIDNLTAPNYVTSLSKR
jgi:exosome complex RNA-binding protein Csl4